MLWQVHEHKVLTHTGLGFTVDVCPQRVVIVLPLVVGLELRLLIAIALIEEAVVRDQDVGGVRVVSCTNVQLQEELLVLAVEITHLSLDVDRLATWVAKVGGQLQYVVDADLLVELTQAVVVLVRTTGDVGGIHVMPKRLPGKSKQVTLEHARTHDVPRVACSMAPVKAVVVNHGLQNVQSGFTCERLHQVLDRVGLTTVSNPTRGVHVKRNIPEQICRFFDCLFTVQNRESGSISIKLVVQCSRYLHPVRYGTRHCFHNGTDYIFTFAISVQVFPAWRTLSSTPRNRIVVEPASQ